ncbi:MFS transporter [Dongia sp.]|uniref:AmpG family muropeptide MFS transporter n=1 Tax=Dongia sp. TaxID=1977262 RepID=UPI0035B43AEB
MQESGWTSALAMYFSPRLIAVFLLGFSSGLPLALTGGTFQIMQADAGVDVATVGLFSLVGVSYALKFVWSPIIDRSLPPLGFRTFGRRRGWALACQLPLALSILCLGLVDLATWPGLAAAAAVCIAFFSASQDIVIDGLRIELLEKEQQGAGAAMVTYGYRIAGSLVAGAGALVIAKYFGWTAAYAVMAACVLVGVVTILAIREPEVTKTVTASLTTETGVLWGVVFVVVALVVAVATYLAITRGAAYFLGVEKWQVAAANFMATIAAASIPLIMLKLLPAAGSRSPQSYQSFRRWLNSSVFSPFADVATRDGWKALLAFIILYKLGDAVLGVNASYFYTKIGFDKLQIAEVTKVFGLLATLLGTFLGGLMMIKLGVARSLIIGGVLQAASNLLYVVQAEVGADVHFLYLTIGVENLTGALGAVVLVGFLSAICNTAFTATQYALFSALAALGRTVLASPFSGLADVLGWANYYFLSIAMAVPGLAMLFWMIKRHPKALEVARPGVTDD